MADRSEYAAYVAARQGPLLRYAYTLCGDWANAEDVVQTALEKLYVAWPRVNRSGHVDAFVRRIVANAAVDTARRPWRREVSMAEPVSGDRDPTSAPEEGSTPQVIAALQSLPPMQRRVVVLRHLMDMSVAQVAAELNISPGSVKSHNARALTRLNAILSAVLPKESDR